MEPESILPCLEEKSPPLIHILSQTKPTLILPFYLLKLSVFIIIIIIVIIVSCHRPFLPGTSLEPAVIPTAQASSFTLQYFPYYV